MQTPGGCSFSTPAVLALFNFADEPRRVPLPAGAWDLRIELGAGETELSHFPPMDPMIYAHVQRRGGLIFVYAAGALSEAGVL